MSDNSTPTRRRVRAPRGHQPLSVTAQRQLERRHRRKAKEARERARLPTATRHALKAWEALSPDEQRRRTGANRSDHPLLSRRTNIARVRVTLRCGYCWRRPTHVIHTQCQQEDAFICWSCNELGRDMIYRKGSADALTFAPERVRKAR